METPHTALELRIDMAFNGCPRPEIQIAVCVCVRVCVISYTILNRFVGIPQCRFLTLLGWPPQPPN